MPNFAKDDAATLIKKTYGPPAPPAGNPARASVWTQAVNKLGAKPVFHPDVIGALRAFEALNYNPRPSGLYPPVTTGPANSPQGVMRATVAPAYSLSDKARGVLSQTPINYQAVAAVPVKGSWLGSYDPSAGSIDIGAYGRKPVEALGTLAHEFTHKWQNTQTPAWNNPGFQQGLVGDVNTLAQSNPRFRDELKAWNKVSSYYPANLTAAELGARTLAGVGPASMPQGFRDRYYPGMFR